MSASLLGVTPSWPVGKRVTTGTGDYGAVGIRHVGWLAILRRQLENSPLGIIRAFHGSISLLAERVGSGQGYPARPVIFENLLARPGPTLDIANTS